MHRLGLRWALGVLTFLVGTSAEVYLRPPGPMPDGYCMTAKCRLVHIADEPAFYLRHPVETIKRLSTTRRFE
ncbi:MAG TPA: hypothetical protein VER08_09535 [Pyrinomonadaceae bacterium]|nr:hypothetical protein [Pyrinomonadaceae bacterium]